MALFLAGRRRLRQPNMIYSRIHPVTSVTNNDIFRIKYRFTKPEIAELLLLIEPYLIDDEDDSGWPIEKSDQVRGKYYGFHIVSFLASHLSSLPEQ